MTKTYGTATINPSVLATSNGHTGMDSKDELGSTSHGSFSGAVGMIRRGTGGMMIMMRTLQGLVGSVLLGLVIGLDMVM